MSEFRIVTFYPVARGWTAAFRTDEGDIYTQEVIGVAMCETREKQSHPWESTHYLEAVVSGLSDFEIAISRDDFVELLDPQLAADESVMTRLRREARLRKEALGQEKP